MGQLVWEENQIKKEYLNGYRSAKKKEQQLLEQIQQLRSDAMFPAMQYDDMPHGTNASDLSDYAARLDELMEELKEERLKAISKYSDIYQRIKAVADEREQEVLTYRYLILDKWEDICVKMGLSWKQIHRVHSKSLENFKMT